MCFELDVKVLVWLINNILFYTILLFEYGPSHPCILAKVKRKKVISMHPYHEKNKVTNQIYLKLDSSILGKVNNKEIERLR